MPSREFARGDRVLKSGGDYTFEGEVVSVFQKHGVGDFRCVVEDDRGLLFIFKPSQLTLHPKQERDDALRR